MPKRVVISWSGGKDSAWTLYTLRQQPKDYVVIGLLTTLNQQFNRIAMHGVRRELLEAQAKAASLPLWAVPLPSPCSNEHYERRMSNALRFMRGLGIDAVAFGDLYLEDIRQYREKQFGSCGLELLFPIWGTPTRELAHQIIGCRFRARLCCVNSCHVPAEWAGREYDQRLLAEMPPSVDPCAENGEFHTFVYDGPIFGSPIGIRTGETVQRDGLLFTDLLANSEPAPQDAQRQTVLAG